MSNDSISTGLQAISWRPSMIRSQVGPGSRLNFPIPWCTKVNHAKNSKWVLFTLSSCESVRLTCLSFTMISCVKTCTPTFVRVQILLTPSAILAGIVVTCPVCITHGKRVIHTFTLQSLVNTLRVPPQRWPCVCSLYQHNSLLFLVVRSFLKEEAHIFYVLLTFGV